MHWPGDGVPLGETLGAMRELQQDGSLLHIGVSNFSPSLVEEAAEHAEIICNQIQYHPYRRQDALVDQAQEMDYLLTAYTPLSRGGVQKDTTLREIGDAHGKTATQAALRWLVQQDKVCAIPKATSEEHLRENLDVFDFELSAEEMDRIYSLGR
jgi:2,5-diketo-D-gluconate reductase B